MIAAELPNRRNEAWKYSDLRAAIGGEIAPLAPKPATTPSASKLFPALKPIEIVFDRGRLARWPSMGVKRDPNERGRISAIPMGRWAAEAAPDEAMIVEVGPDTPPVHLRLIGASEPTTSQARIGFVVPENGSLDLIETYEGPSNGLTNVLIEALVRNGAKLSRTVLHDVGASAVQVSTAQVKLSERAGFRQFVVSSGSKLTRIETHVSVEGEGAEAELNGLYMCAEGRHADLTSVIEHKVGGGQTRQLIKGVARKGGRGVFQGKIVVDHGAQKTDARQYHHGLLLEDAAEIFAKPELMIHADDVQCAHGNTAGGLDETALFYMRSRGTPELEARALLIEAFLSETIPDWAPLDVREEIEARIRGWLGGAS